MHGRVVRTNHPRMKIILGIAFASPLLLLTGCYGADFTETGAGYTPRPRAPESVQISSERPGPGYREVGLLTGSGGSFEGAVKRIKEEAGDRGCDVVTILGEAIQSGYGTPGAAYGMTKNHVRAACYVATHGYVAAAPPPPPPPPVAAPVEASACAPACRLGYDCLNGSCVSACNPPCGAGQECTGHGGQASCKGGGAGSAATN